MSEWTHRQCERCWVDDNAARDSDGNILLRVPHMIKVAAHPGDEGIAPGPCCFCGHITILGIYVREDPSSERLSYGCNGEHEGATP